MKKKFINFYPFYKKKNNSYKENYGNCHRDREIKWKKTK